MNVAATAAAATVQRPLGAGLRWSLMAGNFVIGFGVMVTAGTLNDIARAFGVSIALAGQLVAVAAATVGLGAPLLAGWVAAFDRRRLLVLALVWYGLGHALSAAMPSYATLLPVRALTMLGAAVFTPQAAAAIGWMAPPAERGRAITFIFLGWSLASVLGMPLAAWIGASAGWPTAFGTVAVLALAAAVAVGATMPDGVRPPALPLRAWGAVLSHPVLMAMVLVTALSGSGQFVLFAYATPYYRDMLGAGPGAIAALLMWFGFWGLVGNVGISRVVDRVGVHTAIVAALGAMALSLLLWPLARGVLAMALVVVPWGLGCFSSNSTQQARFGIVAPAFAPALMALNTSAIYLGQAIGASGGGWLIGHAGYEPLHWFGLAAMLAAIGVSLWAARRLAGQTGAVGWA